MRWAIAAEGGAIRTIFSCGVMDVLLEEDLLPDCFVGVSAGIAYGVSYIARQKGRNLEILEKYVHDPQYMGWRNLFRPRNRSYYNLDFSFREIPKKHIPFDYEAFAAYKGRLLAAVTNVHTGKAEYLDVPLDASSYLHLEASCALPFLFPIITVDDVPYLDGGITDPVPFRRAMEEGCEKCIAILTREEGYRKGDSPGEKAAAMAYRRYPALSGALRDRQEVYNRQREEIESLERDGKLLVIYPEDTAGFGRMEKDLDKIRALYEQGRRITRARMDEIRTWLEIP